MWHLAFVVSYLVLYKPWLLCELAATLFFHTKHCWHTKSSQPSLLIVFFMTNRTTPPPFVSSTHRVGLLYISCSCVLCIFIWWVLESLEYYRCYREIVSTFVTFKRCQFQKMYNYIILDNFWTNLELSKLNSGMKLYNNQ